MNDLGTIAATYFPESADRAARCLEALKADRAQVEKWAWDQAASHQRICAAAYDAKDKSVGDIHNALASAYTSLISELRKSSGRAKE
jgi:hypothetical protein